MLAIHAVAVMQAVDHLGLAGRLSPRCQAAYQQVRAVFPAVGADQPHFLRLRQVVALIQSEDLGLL